MTSQANLPLGETLEKLTKNAWLHATDQTAFPPELMDLCERVYKAGFIGGLLVSTESSPMVKLAIAEAKTLFEGLVPPETNH